MRRVTSLCSQCYAQVPAALSYEAGAVMLTKECPTHGRSEVLIDPDTAAFQEMYARFVMDDPLYTMTTTGATILNTTDRCNLRCRNCYHPVDNVARDPGIDVLVAQAELASQAAIILMGAEPTMRPDLLELIARIRGATGKPVLIYTNGVRLADPEYVRGLTAAGLSGVCVSLHTRSYSGPEIYEKKKAALRVIADTGLPVHHIAFTLSGFDEMLQVAQDMKEFWDLPHHFRLRCPSPIGRHEWPIYPSEFYLGVLRGFCEVGWSDINIRPGDNTPYHVNLDVHGRHVRVVRWPSVEEVILDDLGPAPTMMLPDGRELNFVHAALLQARDRKTKQL